MAFRNVPFVLLFGFLVQLGFAQDTSPTGPVHDGQPANCNGWHTVVSGDTCSTVPQKYGITFDQFRAWNPAVSADCIQNFWLGSAYCVRVGATPDPSPTGPVHEGQPSDCNAWHTIVSGDTCQTVPEKFGITFDQFMSWNPAISADCVQNFWLGNAYCVGVGAKASATASSSSSSSPSSTTTTTKSPTITSTRTTTSQNLTYSTREPLTTWNFTTPATDKTWPPTITQVGQPKACNRWHLVSAGQTCEQVLNRYGNLLTSEQLHEWNPELHDDCSGLYADYWICVGIRSDSNPDFGWSTSTPPFTPPPAPSSHTPTVFPTANSSFSPTPSQGPMPANCKNYHLVAADENCRTILDIYQYITEQQFFAWNPALNGNCNGLWAENWYCVAAGDDDSLPMPATVTATPTPIPSQSPGDCKAWYQTTVDDTCDLIVSIFGTFDLQSFLSWNPSVFDDCSGIKQGAWYCVGKADTPTTRTSGAPTPTFSDLVTSTEVSTTSTSSAASATGATTTGSGTQPISTPSPVREGMTTQCRRFYLQQLGDLCWSMAQSAGITTDQFIEWNPAVGADCGNLWPDYYYCIGIAGPVTTISSGPPVPT